MQIAGSGPGYSEKHLVYFASHREKKKVLGLPTGSRLHTGITVL